MKYDIAISVVCYNNEKEIVDFVHQLEKQSIYDRLYLVVTCNSSASLDGLRLELSNCSIENKVCFPQENMGYLNGCLYGLAEIEKEIDYRWAMISNTDITLNSKYYFESFVKDSDENNDVWCVGPQIRLKETGKNQNPFVLARPSKVSMMIRRIAYSNSVLFRGYFFLSSVKEKWTKNETNFRSGCLYSVHGSCFFVTKNCVKALRNEGNKIFMYGEELFIAEVIKKNGKKTYYNENLVITHNENQVTGKIGTKKKQKWFKESFAYIYETFY